jgi:DNA-binding CsgD family transcriptional regulator
MSTDTFLMRQRLLRQRWLDDATAIRWRPGRDLLAHLLLHLDEPTRGWKLLAEGVREALDADRVDGGWGGFVYGGAQAYGAVAEVQRGGLGLPPVCGLRFDAHDAGLRQVWVLGGLALPDVARDTRLGLPMRQALAQVGTAAKWAMPVCDGERPVGLLCVDWARPAPRWNAGLCADVADFVRVLGAALAPAVPDTPPPLLTLTPAERRVAELVAGGLSYKEVARCLDRSLSTVDHQLRSIRHKLGVSSTARLVHLWGQWAASGPQRTTEQATQLAEHRQQPRHVGHLGGR